MRYRFHLWVRATRKDALNESYDEGNTDIVVNQGHRSNLWSLSVICWRCELMMSAVMFQAFFAPAVTLLIPHSLSLSALLSWPLSLLFFFYFIAFRMSLSHSICPLSHSCHCLSFSLLYELKPVRYSSVEHRGRLLVQCSCPSFTYSAMKSESDILSDKGIPTAYSEVIRPQIWVFRIWVTKKSHLISNHFLISFALTNNNFLVFMKQVVGLYCFIFTFLNILLYSAV